LDSTRKSALHFGTDLGELGERGLPLSIRRGGLKVFDGFGGDVNASHFNAATVHRFNRLRITVHDSRFCSDFRPPPSDL
jgi:hypothetical protein